MMLAVPGDSAAKGASPVPKTGTTANSVLLWSKSATAPRRRPGASGRNCTSTLHVVLVVPLVQVVPAPSMKSRLCAPTVRACTLPSVVATPTVNGKVTDVLEDAPTCSAPNPTAEFITWTTRLLEV